MSWDLLTASSFELHDDATATAALRQICLKADRPATARPQLRIFLRAGSRLRRLFGRGKPVPPHLETLRIGRNLRRLIKLTSRRTGAAAMDEPVTSLRAGECRSRPSRRHTWSSIPQSHFVLGNPTR